ncbi:MAG TPA: YtxH domain-containing protein [Gemmatimonadota bacterium]|nr:YtxH domain-containing protein [Gemmatimonadota bacterium]
MIGRLKALATGFLIGIFVAPRSGRASRQMLMERINEFFELGTRRLEELEDELLHRRRGTGDGYPESPDIDADLYAEEPFPDEPLP